MQQMRTVTALVLAHLMLYLPVISCGRSTQSSSATPETRREGAIEAPRASSPPTTGTESPSASSPSSSSPSSPSSPPASASPLGPVSANLETPPDLPSPLLQPTVASSRPSYENAVTELEQFLSLLAEMRDAIDRTRFDLEAVVDSLDYEASEIEAFVRDQIAYEAYPGLLRGARGTLMSRAGNSLDQAVLLATLAGDAGHETRIRRATLTDGQAASLLDEMRRPRVPPPSLGDDPELRRVLERLLRLGSDDETTARLLALADRGIDVEASTTWARSRETGELLLAELDWAGISLAPRSVHDELLAEAADYFWVEHRLGPASPWRAAHPAFGDPGAVPDELVAVETYADTVPQELQHRLRIRVAIDRRLGEKRETVEVMAPWERPVSNLVGHRLSFWNHPSGIRGPADLDLAEIVADTEYFVPSFDGGRAQGTKVFDLDGVALSPDVVAADSFGAGAVIREVAGKTESAANALSALGTRDPEEGEQAPDLRALEGQWIEYSLIAPGGSERTFRRQVLSPADAADPDRAVWRLATHHGIAVAVGTLPPAYLLDRQLERLLQLEDLLRWVLAKRYDRAEREQPDPRWLAALEDHPELRYFDVFDAGARNREAASAYRAEPSLLVTRQGLAPRGDETRLLAEVDVIQNRRRVVRTEGEGFVSAPRTALRIGAWETQMEGAGFALPSESRVRHVSAIEGLRAALEGEGLRVIRPGEIGELRRLSVPDASREGVEADLERGYAVLLPRDAEAEEIAASWWRVDPVTGETLGRGGDGRGIAMTEYEIVFTRVSLGFGLLFGVGTFVNCITDQDSPCSAWQCLGTATIGALIGFAFSYAIGWILVAALPTELAIGAGVTLTKAETAKAIGSAVLFSDLVIGSASLELIPACLQ